jgi:hypothetical protein
MAGEVVNELNPIDEDYVFGFENVILSVFLLSIGLPSAFIGANFICPIV